MSTNKHLLYRQTQWFCFNRKENLLKPFSDYVTMEKIEFFLGSFWVSERNTAPWRDFLKSHTHNAALWNRNVIYFFFSHFFAAPETSTK